MSQEGPVSNATLRQGTLSWEYWGAMDDWGTGELCAWILELGSGLCFLSRAHALWDQGENWAHGERCGMAV